MAGFPRLFSPRLTLDWFTPLCCMHSLGLPERVNSMYCMSTVRRVCYMPGERACGCECDLGVCRSLRDSGVDHQSVLVTSRTLVVHEPILQIHVMEFAVGRSDMEPREGLAQSLFISMKGDQIIIQISIDSLELDFKMMRLRCWNGTATPALRSL